MDDEYLPGYQWHLWPHHHTHTYEPDDRPTHSQLIGPDGQPLRYAPKQRIGFILPHERRKNEGR